MKSWETDISPQLLLAAVSAAAIYFGSVFQVGYFFWYGTSFLSFVSVTDWFLGVTLLGSMLVPLSLPWALIYLGVRSRREAILARQPSDIFTLVSLLPVGLAVIYWIEDDPYSNRVVYGVALAYLTGAVVIAAALVNWVPMNSARCASIFVIATYLAFAIGAFLGLRAETSCRISTSSGSTVDVNFVRNVGTGLLLIEEGRRVFLPNAEVKRLDCEPRPAFRKT